MRRWAFVIAILGMFVLALLMNYLPAKEIKSYEDLQDLEINARVSLNGEVVEERIIYEGTKILILDNYDSFTFNLYQCVGEALLDAGQKFKLDVLRNDEITIHEKHAENLIRLMFGEQKLIKAPK